MYTITAQKGDDEVVVHGRVDPNARIKDGKLTEYINTSPMFSYTIYPNNPGYDMMEDMLTKVEVYDRKASESIFVGRIYSTSDVMSGDGVIYKTITCEGELAYLCDTVQPYRHFIQGRVLQEAIDVILDTHNQKVDDGRKISPYGGALTVLPEEYEAEYITTFDMVKELCELCGYEFRITYSGGTRYLEVKKQFGAQSGTDIALSVNLKSLQREVKANDIVTRFYPLGAINPNTGRRLTIATSGGYLENAALKAVYGVVEGCKVYDIAPTEWGDGTAVYAASNKLKAAGQKDYNKMIGLLTSFKLEAVDLSLINGDYSDLRMYNTHRVITKLQGIDDTVRITGRTLYLDEPQNPTLTFGVKQTTLTGMLAGR